MGMAQEMMLVSESLVMQTSLQTIVKIVLILGLTLLTNLTSGQETATEDAAEIDEEVTANQADEDTGEAEIPAQFVPKETISPDNIISFPADI